MDRKVETSPIPSAPSSLEIKMQDILNELRLVMDALQNTINQDAPILAQLIEEGVKTKCFGKPQVIKDCSMSIRQGEIYGLLGANGAGKTF